MKNVMFVCLVLIGSMLLSMSILQAQSKTTEELVITTYYPVPYGDYNELRLRRLAVGNDYKNAGEYCWEGDCNNRIPESTDAIIQRNVAIGKHGADAQGHQGNKKQVALDVNGYASTNDVWLAKPIDGGDGFWASERRFVGQCIENYPQYWAYWTYFPQTCQADGPAFCDNWYTYAYWVTPGSGFPAKAEFCACPSGMQQVYLGGSFDYGATGNYKFYKYNAAYRDTYVYHGPYVDAYWAYYYGPGKLYFTCYKPSSAISKKI